MSKQQRSDGTTNPSKTKRARKKKDDSSSSSSTFSSSSSSTISSSSPEPETFNGYSVTNFDREGCNPGIDTAFMFYGRLAPSHRGHRTVILAMIEQAKAYNSQFGLEITPENTNVYVFASPSGMGATRNAKNPYHPNEKVRALEEQCKYEEGEGEEIGKAFPIHIVNMGEAKYLGKGGGPATAVHLLKSCGYTNSVMFIGEDRIGAFDWLGNMMEMQFESTDRPPHATSGESLRKIARMVQTRSLSAIFAHAVQRGTMTDEHVAEIIQLIRAFPVKQKVKQKGKGKKTRRKTRRKTRKKTRRKTRRKTRKKTRRKTRKAKRGKKEKLENEKNVDFLVINNLAII